MGELDAPSWIVSVVAGARNAHNWLAAADELKRGSDILREKWLAELQQMREDILAHMSGGASVPQWKPSVGASAMTLAAFALENVLKGLLIASNPGLVQPSGDRPEELLTRSLQTHDLRRLADMAGVDPSADERALLERLTEFTSWAGRYRFPLNAMDAAPRIGAEGGGSSFTSEWFPTLDSLFERLRDELFQAGARADREREATAAEATRIRREEILASLDELTRVEIENGVVVYETDLPDEPGAAIGCGRCGVTLNLNQQRPAAICRCGTLYFGEKRGVAGRVMFTADAFPNAEPEG